MELEKKLSVAEENLSNQSLAYEMLKDYRVRDKRKDYIIYALLLLVAFTIGIFVWYINQYDYSTTVEATGIYNAVDHSGNIVTKDVSPEMWAEFERWIAESGDNKGNTNQN